MKIEWIKLKNFKRFTDLTIEGLPETAKLVVMIGPNGCGKSSVFDALKLLVYFLNAFDPMRMPDDYYQILEYYLKSDEDRHSYSHYGSLNQTPNDRMKRYLDTSVNPFNNLFVKDLMIKFYGKEFWDDRDFDKRVHVRSAYRNYSVTQTPVVSRHDPLQEYRLVRLMENDETFASNCRYLVSRWLERSSKIGESEQNLTDLQNEIFGELRDAIGRLFTDPPLVLRSLGHPTDGDLFEFDKGTSERFTYQNLASGEKAALDLLLDVIVTKTEDDEMVICIDEPEAHIHTKLQGQLLEELHHLTPEKSQLWIATHSIGMVRKAQDLWRKYPGSVVFLDFGKGKDGKDRDFDGPEKIEPAAPNPSFWAQTYDVALGDLAKLVAPERIVLCEGKIEDAQEGFDAACYNQIFGGTHLETLFISIGAASDIKVAHKNRIPLIKAIAGGIQTITVRDKDILRAEQIEDGFQTGVRTLTRRELENYLLADEVLIKLCHSKDKFDKVDELLAAKRRLKKDVLKSNSEADKPDDQLKCIAKPLYESAKDILDLQGEYTSKEPEKDFMKCDLAPLIHPDMTVYQELHKDIFDE